MCTLDSFYLEYYDCLTGEVYISCLNNDDFVPDDCRFCSFYKEELSDVV